MKVIIASRNPVKTNATRVGFNRMFSEYEFHFESVAVPSDVSDQPMESAETLKGAMNRAQNARDAQPDADYWVGIEGGIEKKDIEMEAFAWVYILSENNSGKARTSTFFLPADVIKLINEGKELGDADDIVFGKSNSKQKNGAVGILTGNVIDRTNYYAEAVILALIPFRNPGLY